MSYFYSIPLKIKQWKHISKFLFNDSYMASMAVKCTAISSRWLSVFHIAKFTIFIRFFHIKSHPPEADWLGDR